ncbi:2833_t:CDS:10 [Ambispora leptoticha]|uniref:Mediator of RNA polymerase II transcription subunit 13 n=1 Tax=Ambispora leptoticha TaxID=144679 RepID=A0A9N9BW78_9GLOM|nr:2833_t:CDS:10 [Ambispora leptoticha]
MASLSNSANSGNNNSKNVKDIESLCTNVLSLAGVSSVGWRKYTFTCSLKQLWIFSRTAIKENYNRYAYSESDSNKDSLCWTRDPIIANQIKLLNLGIPCVWRYANISTGHKQHKQQAENSNRIIDQIIRQKIICDSFHLEERKEDDEQEVTRELWVFWLNHQEKPEEINHLEGLKDASEQDCYFSWEQLESPPIEYGLFLKAYRNLINRSMISQGGIPIGEWYAFPALSNKTVDEGTLSCKFDMHLTSTSLIFQPIVKYRKIRPLQTSDLKSPPPSQQQTAAKVLIAPIGIEAELVLSSDPKFSHHNNTESIFAEFYDFFKLDLFCSEPATQVFDSALPGLVNVRINIDEKIVKEIPYPSRCIYFIINSNNNERIISEGLVPGIGKRISALDKMHGEPGNWLLCSVERKTLPEKDIEWWNFSNYLDDIDSKYAKDNPGSTSSISILETTMTPNTPGVANDTSNTNSPGKPQTPQTKHSTNVNTSTEATYPSPPDPSTSFSTEYSTTEDVLAIQDQSFYNNTNDHYYDISADITDHDFDFFGEKPISTITNNYSPTPEVPGSIRDDHLSLDTPGIHNQSPAPVHRHPILPDLSYIVKQIKNPLVPPKWAPLIFPHVDTSKFAIHHNSIVKSSKRKNTDIYSPYYRPKFLPKRKKAKTGFNNKKAKAELKNKDNESETASPSETSSSYVSSDSEDNESVNASTGTINDSSNLEQFVDVKLAQSKINKNNTLMDIINCARFVILFDNHYDSRNVPFFHPYLEINREDYCEGKAVYLLRDQIVFGSYPYAGEHLEELATSPAYPSEVKIVIQKLKLVLDDIKNRFPKLSQNMQLSIKGPLKMSEYHALNEEQQNQQKYSNTKFVSKTKQLNCQILNAKDLVVGFKSKYHIEVSADQLRFWERHKLEPPEGKKRISYFVLHPECENLQSRIMTFFKQINRTFMNCELGSHSHEKLDHYPQGLIPIKLLKGLLHDIFYLISPGISVGHYTEFSHFYWTTGLIKFYKSSSPVGSSLQVPLRPVANAGESDTERALRSYIDTIQSLRPKLAKLLLTKQSQGTLNYLMIYIVNPFTHSTAYYDICKVFAKLQTQLKLELKKLNYDTKLIDYVTFQVMPIDHIIKFSINGGSYRQGLVDIAFSIYTRSMHPQKYSAPYILPPPDPIAVNFQNTEQPPSIRDLITSGVTLHMAYGYSPDRRWLANVFTNNIGNLLESSILPMIESNTKANELLLIEQSWRRTLLAKKTMEDSQQIVCQNIVICKMGSMTEEERKIWIELTKGSTTIISIDLSTNFDFIDTFQDETPKVYGIVLNNPIPRIDFRPVASGYFLEVASVRGPLVPLQVDLIYKPDSLSDRSPSVALWEILREFHSLSHLDTTPMKNNCLPMHLQIVERLTRVLLGVAF